MKRFYKVFACAMVALMLLSLSGCGQVLTKITKPPQTTTTTGTGTTTTAPVPQVKWEILREGPAMDDVRYSKGTVNYRVSVFKKDGKYGLVDFNGKIVVPAQYQSIELSEVDYGSNVTMLRGYKEDWSETVFEADGRVSNVVMNAWGYESTCHVYWKDGQVVEWGSGDGSATGYREDWHPLYNMLGTIALTPSNIVAVQEMKGYTTNEWDETVVEVVSEKYALLDYDTKTLLTDFIYEDCSSIGFVEGVLPVKKNGKWGYVNEKGEELTPFVYDASEIGEDNRWNPVRMYACTNGYIVVRQGDKWGLIDQYGTTVVEPIYEGISQVADDGLFWIKKDGKWWVAKAEWQFK